MLLGGQDFLHLEILDDKAAILFGAPGLLSLASGREDSILDAQRMHHVEALSALEHYLVASEGVLV